jgi:hypothetical protein
LVLSSKHSCSLGSISPRHLLHAVHLHGGASYC